MLTPRHTRLVFYTAACAACTSCSALGELPALDRRPFFSTAQVVGADDELRPRVSRQRASDLPVLYREDGGGLALAEWLRVDLRTNYRDHRWALAYSVLRLVGVTALSADNQTRASAELSGGAGAGVGGGACLRDGSCVDDGAGPRWYEGMTYGGFVAVGAGLSHRSMSLFSRMRLEVIEGLELEPAYRFMASVGLQWALPEGFRIYATGGYIADWDDETLIRGPAWEVGLIAPLELFRPRRSRSR